MAETVSRNRLVLAIGVFGLEYTTCAQTGGNGEQHFKSMEKTGAD